MPSGYYENLKDAQKKSLAHKVDAIVKQVEEHLNGPFQINSEPGIPRDSYFFETAGNLIMQSVSKKNKRLQNPKHKRLIKEANEAQFDMLTLIEMTVFVNKLFEEEYDYGLSRDIEYERFGHMEVSDGVQILKRLSVIGQIRKNLSEQKEKELAKLKKKNSSNNLEVQPKEKGKQKEKKYCLLGAILDLRSLRAVDKFNSLEADLLLIKVAKELKTIVRQYKDDYPEINFTIGRYGGDEFIILLEGVMDPKKFQEIMSEIMPIESKEQVQERKKQEGHAGFKGSILKEVAERFSQIKAFYALPGQDKPEVRGAAIKEEVKYIQIPEGEEDLEIWERFLERGMLLDEYEIRKAKEWLKVFPDHKMERIPVEVPIVAEEIEKKVASITTKYPRLAVYFEAAKIFDQVWLKALGASHGSHVTRKLLETFLTKIINPLLGEYFYSKDKIQEFYINNEYQNIIVSDAPLKEINDNLGFYEGDWLIKTIGERILGLLFRKKESRSIFVDHRADVDISGGEGSSYYVAIKKNVVGLENLTKEIQNINAKVISNPNLDIPMGVASLEDYKKAHNGKNPQNIFEIKRMAENDTNMKMLAQMKDLYKKLDPNSGTEFDFADYLIKLSNKMISLYPLTRNDDNEKFANVELSKATSMDEFYYLYFIKSVRAEDRRAKFLDVIKLSQEKIIHVEKQMNKLANENAA